MRRPAVSSLIALFLAVGISLMLPSTAEADPCTGGSEVVDDLLVTEMTCSSGGIGNSPGGSSGDSGTAETSSGGTSSEPAYLSYRWHSPCTNFASGQGGDAVIDCGLARACPQPNERSWQLWGLSAQTKEWDYIASQCYAEPPTIADAPAPTVTPALVLNALRQMGLPSLEAVTQPDEKTLVNFETIFYTEPQQFTRTITLLGQSVDVEATPSQFTWDHGDGTTATTSTPGAPYPAKEITYNYTDAHVTVAPRVDVTYTARFRVNGGGWQGIDETVTIPGPPSALRISEATALLSGEYQ